MSENIDVQDFELGEDLKTTEVDPLDELVGLNFEDGEDFDVEKFHQEIQKLKRYGNSDELKLLEAENILKELGPKYLNDEYQEELDRIAKSLTNYINKFSVGGEEMIKIENSENPDKVKDKVYELANFLFNNFIAKINNILFSMEMTVGEHKFLDTTLRQKTEYDGNEVLNIITLIPKLDEWKETVKSMPKGAESFMVDVTIQEVVMIYHFISKHKAKGFGAELYNFYNLLTKIGETNKIFNAYNVIKDRLGEDFKQWTTSITIQTPEPNFEKEPVSENLEGQNAEGMVFKDGEWVKA